MQNKEDSNDFLSLSVGGLILYISPTPMHAYAGEGCHCVTLIDFFSSSDENMAFVYNSS